MNHNAIPLEIYSLHLSTINDIKFSKREIDIIACILSGRSAKGIAHFLSIAPKTAEVHIYNVMKKLGCNSRDNVITLIQNSDKFLIVKQYYLSLLTYLAFEESLKEIAQLIGDKCSTCFIVSDKEQNQSFFLQQLKSNLDLIGLKTIVEVRKTNEPIVNLIQKTKAEDFVIFYTQTLLNEEDYKNISMLTQKESKTFCLVFENEEEKNKNNLKKLDDAQCVTLTNYYSSVFEILQKFFPEIKIHDVAKKFEKQRTFTQESLQPNQTQKEHVLGVEKSSEFLNPPLLKYRKWGILISSGLVLGALSIGTLTYKGLKEEKRIDSVARSDLILPSENVLLNRPDLISKIEEKLTEKPGIRTVALVGMGGVGKTTLARQYGRQQNASVVWEINAETDQSLQSSFEDLAISLAQKPDDKKVLREIQETKDPKERETKLLSFVKEHLQSLLNWLLIYDNVEKFSDIQKYFPHDPNTWGAGKVLITTRDNNIQNDNHVNYTIQLGELSTSQKLALFSKIIENGNIGRLTKAKQEEVQQFLEKIPPFPLDISVAAYYINSTNTPYEKYVTYLNKDNENFIKINEKIQTETGNYSKTRYNIISTSLKSLLSMNKNFTDLLLLISLIDSQNIPRDLLVKYKNDVIVDNFIYHLKKYSLISNEPILHSSTATLFMHRTIQKLLLNYLRESIASEEMNKLINRIAKGIENYAFEKIQAEDNLNIKFLVNHCENFLKHNDLVLPSIRGGIIGELGGMYFYLGNYSKAKELLEESLASLNKQADLPPITIARNLEWLGNVNRELGNYKDAVQLLEESLSLYRKHFSENDENIARALAYLGNANRNLGNVKKAKILLEESLQIYRNYYPNNHATLARILGYLGHIYWILGDLQKAKILHTESYKIYTTYCPDNKTGIARSLAYLGKTYNKLGEFKSAQASLEKSYELYKKYYGQDHIDVAWTSVHLGGAYDEEGTYEKAAKILQETLATYRKHYDDNHIDVAWVSVYLGSTYSHLREHDKAITLLERSRQIYEKTFGKNHTDTAMVLTTLGRAYLQKGSLQEAQLYTGQANKIFNEQKHPEAYTSFETLGDIYIAKTIRNKNSQNNEQTNKNLREKAHFFLEQALKIIKDNFPKDSPHIIRIQNKIKNLDKKLRPTPLPSMSYLKQTSYYAY